jgi:hypothetical protein
LEGLEDRLFEPESGVKPPGQIRRVPDPRKPGRQAAIAPEQLLGLHKPGGWVGGEGAQPNQKAARLQQVQVPMNRGLWQGRIPSQLGLVEQARTAVGGQSHDPLEVREIRHGTQLPQVPFQVGLDISGEPELSGFYRGRRQRGWESTGQQPALPVPGLVGPIPGTEVLLKQAIQRLKTIGPGHPFRGAERGKVQVDRPPGQRVGDRVHQQQVGRPGQQKLPGNPVLVHPPLDRQQQLGRPLDFIHSQRTRNQQGIRI